MLIIVKGLKESDNYQSECKIFMIMETLCCIVTIMRSVRFSNAI